MPEDAIIMTDLEKAVENLEDSSLSSHWSRSQNYNVIQKALNSGEQVHVSVIERVLAVCEHDMKEDIKYTANTMSIICSILKRVKAGDFPSELNLLSSALGVIKVIKTTALMIKTGNLKALCFETFMSYPDEILIKIAMEHCMEVMEIFNLYGHQRKPMENRIQPCSLLYKLLKVLPIEKRGGFVKAGMSTWFSIMIPTIMAHQAILNEDNLVPLLTLETLTDELVYIDYADNLQWQTMLDNICNPKKYPQIIKLLLENNSDTWHRLWIVFIKLLKSQITRSTNAHGSPINSMLLIVETAFKMDVNNRCRAFQCWIALIDNFCTETNEGYITKRLKLLVVPLLSNNAKVEETAIAKLDCWWHLIVKFQHKMDKFVSVIVIPFIRICFGKAADGEKRVIVPGRFSNTTKQQCRQALVEIFGHADCNGCTSIPKLRDKILNTQYLVEYLAEWLHAFKSAVMLASNLENEKTGQQIMCLWKSLIKTISDMPDNAVRKDVTSEALSTVSHMVLNAESNDNVAETVFNILIHSFDDDKVKQIFKGRDVEEGAICNLINVLMHPSMHSYYQRYNMTELVSKFSPVATFIVEEAAKSSAHVTKSLLKDLIPNRNGLAFWTSVAESMCESEEDICSYNLCGTLLWPLTHMDKFSKDNNSADIWYILYNSMYTKIKKTTIEKEVIQILLDSCKITDSVRIWKLYAALAILKHGMNTEDNDYGRVAELLQSLITDVNVFEHEKDILSVLVDTVVIMMEYSATTVNEIFALATVSCSSIVLKYLAQKYTKDSKECHLIMIKNLLKPVGKLFNVESSTIQFAISAQLVEVSSLLSKHASINNDIRPVIESCLLISTADNQIAENLKKAIDCVTGINNVSKNAVVPANQNLDKNTFSTPITKIIVKKSKKKEASIVNTVVENGEEFVVVKSNWKFNPRKLTENQKEKLQRKREDIPALYQDLSQSQDEFKLAAWKTDSQDASSTNSKSTSKSANEESSSILQNMPNTDVVPKIMEHLLTDNNKKCVLGKKEDNICTNNTIQALASPRSTKSPRMALKDRVFRNVRNLIEKSSSPHENQNVSINVIQNEKTPKTPTSKTKMTCNGINSAPPMISSERPSRVKRKPRKFDDTELFALKRGRRSRSQSDSPPDTDLPDITSVDTDVVENDTKNKEDICAKPLLIIDTKVEPHTSMENIESSHANVIDSVTDVVVIPQEDITKSANNKTYPEGKCIDTIVLDSDINGDIVESLNINGTENSDSNNFMNQHSIETDNNKTAANNIDPKETEDEETTNQDSKNKFVENVTSTETKLITNTDSIHTLNADSNFNKMMNVDDSSENINSENTYVTEVTTPKPIKGKQINAPKSSSKRPKKSRIENELAIDMVEGHPYLKIQSEKRLTRKHITSLESNVRRKSLHDKLNKTKLNFPKSLSKVEKKTKNKGMVNKSDSVAVSETDDMCSIPSPDISLSEEQVCSEDVIESSQDSTFTTISVKSAKKIKKFPVVTLDKITDHIRTSLTSAEQKQIDDRNNQRLVLSDEQPTDITIQESKDDIELTRNQTAIEEKIVLDSTENMDTQPIMDKESSDDVIIINDEECEVPITISTEDTIGPETQEIAEADTQPNDPATIQEYEHTLREKCSDSIIGNTEVIKDKDTSNDNAIEPLQITGSDVTEAVIEVIESDTTVEKIKASGTSSPCKGDAQREKDFLNNTFEISPIKTMSPDREKKSPSPETSGEYVVIKLSSPVQSNGEPFDTCGSPEFFTDDKISPDKRDLSPPRPEVNVTNTSPSSSLSLKKNRPQVRSGGRGAQMLGLCVPESLPSMKTDRVETDEPNKNLPKNNTLNTTPARRNLRILYNTVSNTSESLEDSEESENFLKLKRLLPTVDSSPSGPILKRKLAEIQDDATISPANKRKRVSFHDPPVSTTISVQKYIDPCGIRSPQNSAQKRLERQMRALAQTNLKSQKRLDTVFKLDSVLTKAVESFADVDLIMSNNDDTQISSLEQTPAVEVVKTSDLNDTDPICSELINCKDPIDNIAADLSSAAMKSLLIKELVGKVETVGDLAKMTELEVNRLCIKAPKVEVARKILTDYASKVNQKNNDQSKDESTVVESVKHEVTLPVTNAAEAELRTIEVLTNDVDMQTDTVKCLMTSTQTDSVPTVAMSVQTTESSFQSTADVISSCYAERQDFADQLGHTLDTASIQQISEKLPLNVLTDTIVKKMTASDSSEVLSSVLQQIAVNSTQKEQRGNGQLSFLRDYLSDKFDSRDLILFCSQLLQMVHDKH